MSSGPVRVLFSWETFKAPGERVERMESGQGWSKVINCERRLKRKVRDV